MEIFWGFFIFFVSVSVLLMVTDSGESQHGIRLNYRGEKGVRGGKERGLSVIWKICGIFSIFCTHWSLSCLPTGGRTAGGLQTSHTHTHTHYLASHGSQWTLIAG